MQDEPDTVLAFSPNRHEDPQFVAETFERDTMFGSTVSGPQCEVCGATEYEVENNALMPRYGACRCTGCNQRYRIVLRAAREVVFPA